MTTTTTKDGHPPERFDKILYSDLSNEAEWVRLGKGSFGCVYKGEYLGIDVAIKEVLRSTDYDVEKYLYREITLMQQCRHPQIVQYLGLCLAPPRPDDPPSDPSTSTTTTTTTTATATSRSTRILIVSEYLPRGNLRQYILDRTLPFPWRLRMSFAIDMARAISYLHAYPRSCMHRDLKGENLLVTENERLKVCDFGLARVVDDHQASAEAQRSSPLTYCGTDGYMSPEILLGEPFSLSTDIFSLGVILIEIASRTLTSQHHFVRLPPDYGLDLDEVYRSVSSVCPPRFVDLAIRCCDVVPERRPTIKHVLDELRDVERDVLARDDRGEGDAYSRGKGLFASASLKGNVGSISYAGSTKKGSTTTRAIGTRARPTAPRLPSFEGQVKLGGGGSSFGPGVKRGDSSSTDAADPERRGATGTRTLGHCASREGSSESDDDGEALLALARADVPIDVSGGPDSEDDDGSAALIATARVDPVEYSTGVLRQGGGRGGGRRSGQRSRLARPYGALGSSSGSTLAGIEGDEQKHHDRSVSLPSLPPSWIAAASESGLTTSARETLLEHGNDDDDDKFDAPEADEDEGTPTIMPRSTSTESKEALSFLTARTSTLSVANAVVGTRDSVHRSVEAVARVPAEEDEDEARDVFHSTFQHPPAVAPSGANVLAGPVPTLVAPVKAPHRFSLIKPGLQRFLSNFSPYAAAYGGSASTVAQGGELHPAPGRGDVAGRCALCTKKFGMMKAYLMCDDCGYACHIKCSDSVSPTCVASPSVPPSATTSPISSPTFGSFPPLAALNAPSAGPSMKSPPPAKPTRAVPPPPMLSRRSSSKDRSTSPGRALALIGSAASSKLVKKHAKHPSRVGSQGSVGAPPPPQGGIVAAGPA
ncbi:hypothetical protein JCM10212_005900 [Sporobolomyces blumeae]